MAALRAELARSGQADAPAPAPAPSLSIGDTVTHTVFRRKGVVTEVDEKHGRVRLDMNGVSMWAELKVLAGLPRAEEPRPAQGKVFGRISAAAAAAQGQSARQAAEAAWSVDVRGMRADEAVTRLQSFIDKAYLAEMHEVEVIHGRGTGALRRAIHEWLAGCSHVVESRLAPADRGGDGMTIVTLR